jgi:hypothetical protein
MPESSKTESGLQSYQGVFVGSLGFGTLQANPYLRVQWISYTSPTTGKAGFSDRLEQALRAAGIEVRPSSTVLAARCTNLDANAIGDLGSRATARFYEGQGYRVATQVPILGEGIFGGVTPAGILQQAGVFNTGVRNIDVVAWKPGLLGGERINAESKVGRKYLNAGPEVTGKPAYQLTRDAVSIFNNRAVRFAGKGLGVAGVVLDGASTAGQINQQISAGNLRGAGLSAAQFAGRQGGGFALGAASGIGGALAGAAFGEGGALAGTIAPGLGNAIGGFGGALVGGIAGAFLGEAGVTKVYNFIAGALSKAQQVSAPPGSSGNDRCIRNIC